MSLTVTSVVNGVLPSGQDVADEIAEFEKILKLRDEIFAGNHPRLTVPAHLLRKVSPASPSNASVPIQAQPPARLPGLGLAQGSPKSPQHAPVTTASGIHPALLTKSDDLVRAETALQRQRLEKQLRDQFEQKRLDFRKKPAPAEAKPDFDISALLAKALEVVKPVSLSKEQSDEGDGTGSVHDSSFYSSKAPDSITDPGDQSASSQDGEIQEDVPAEGADTSMNPPAAATRRSPQAQASKHSTNPFDKPQDIDGDDEDEEGEYSPPEADQFPAQNGHGSHVLSDTRSRQVQRYSDLDHNGKRPASPPEPHMRIVRNHITSPLAPQPSRVSPLALTKDSLVSQGRHYQNGRQRQRADSPSQSPENTNRNTNKRRKLTKKEEKRQRRSGVKQENISPPPFHDIQPLGTSKVTQPDDRPVIVDEPLPQREEVRYMPPAPRYIDSPQRPLSRQAEIVPLSEPRVLSRAGMRPRGGEQDLRRVASMHNLRAEQPREYVEYAPAPPRERATSYMRVDSPMREMPREYGSDGDRPIQEARVVRTPAPSYREMYQDEPEVRYIPEPMLPPPRERIVVDQYGRRFREIIQERPQATPQRAVSSYIPRQSVAPPRYYDEYSPHSGSVMVEERLPPPPRFEQQENMPPPRLMRPIDEPPQTPTATHRDMYEPRSTDRPASVAVFERSQQARQIVYADTPTDSRLPVRMSSVRPPPSQHYEDQPPIMQMMSRAGSVRPLAGQPTAREGSVFLDDRASVRREYLPVDPQPMQQMQQPRYRVIEQDRGQDQVRYEPMSMPQAPRYIDAQGREMVPAGSQMMTLPMEDGQGHGQGGLRYVQRY